MERGLSTLLRRKESDLQSCCDSQSRKRLNSYRGMLYSDSDHIIFDDKLRDLLLEYSWDPELVTQVNGYLNNLVSPGDVKFARSIKSYSSLAQLMSAFCLEEAAPFVWNQNFKKAVGIVRDRYSRTKLKPLSYQSNNDILEAISDSHTSAGWTYIRDGYRHKCDFPEEALLSTYNSKVQLALDEGSFNAYSVLFWRTQCSGEYDESGNETDTCKHKTRPVWAVDMWTVICELRWAKPLNLFLKQYPYSAIGKDDRTISRDINYWRMNNPRWISVDYSHYDSTIPSWLIHEAFNIIANMFAMDDTDTELLRILEKDFTYKNAIMYDEVLHVTHGNPSGSGFTAIINGICNEIITETWRIKFGVPPMDYMIMGDDNLIFLRDMDLDFSDIASYISYNFGIEANAEKGSQGTRDDSPQFLSRTWLRRGPYRHPKILISKMLFPERFRNYGEEITPELVFYSYVLGYRAGMEEAFDLDRFFRDNPQLNKSLVIDSREVLKQMPYNVQIAWAA